MFLNIVDWGFISLFVVFIVFPVIGVLFAGRATSYKQDLIRGAAVVGYLSVFALVVFTLIWSIGNLGVL